MATQNIAQTGPSTSQKGVDGSESIAKDTHSVSKRQVWYYTSSHFIDLDLPNYERLRMPFTHWTLGTIIVFLRSSPHHTTNYFSRMKRKTSRWCSDDSRGQHPGTLHRVGETHYFSKGKTLVQRYWKSLQNAKNKFKCVSKCVKFFVGRPLFISRTAY